MSASIEPFAHLTAEAARCMSLPLEQRIEQIRSARWIGYPHGKAVMNRLEDLLSWPKSHRMPNLLLVGDTNNGKTMLVRRFEKQHPAMDNEEGGNVIVPVMVIQAPPVPDEARFYNVILQELFAPCKASDRVDKKQAQVINLLRYVEMRMLIIDEIHHMLAGNLNRQRAFLNVIKYLGNELQIPIVGVGTRDAFRAIQTDPQLANRFEPVLLPRWAFNRDFLRLLASFERMIPLAKPSRLYETSLATKLLSMSEGYLGELAKLLNSAAVRSASDGYECIDAKVLDAIGWVAPSMRRRQIEQMAL